MKKLLIKQTVLASAALFVFALAAPITVNAHSEHGEDTQSIEQNHKNIAQDNSADKKEEAKTKQADAKLKACQKREKKINNIMNHLAGRGTKQIDVFTKISERTQAFYTKKGKTLTNYDALVADVNAKKAAAQVEVAKVKETSVAFKCDGTDPKGAIAGFKESRKAEQAALKEYKTAVKNLIVGVKSVQKTENKQNTEGGRQ